jgi:PAS domain S-box-containing protein
VSAGEFSRRRQDGSIGYHTFSATPVRQGDQIAGLEGFLIDITARKQAEEALKESEDKYRTVADFTYDWEYWLGPDGDYLYVSPACERITGYGPAEFQGNPALLEAITHPAERELVTQDLHRLEESRAPHSMHFRILARNGETRWIGHWCQPVYSAEGKYLGRRGSNRDITEGKQAEEALRESEARYRGLLENTVMGISQALPDGRLIWANSAYACMYGYSNPEEMIAQVSDVGHQLYANSEDREEVLHILKEKGVMEPREMAVVRKDGTQFFVLVGAREIRDSRGDLICYQAEHIDITADKEAEAALRESEERWRSLVSASPDYIALHDPEGKYLFLNHYAEGFTEQDVIGNSLYQYISPGSAEIFRKNMEAALATWTTQRFEFTGLGDTAAWRTYEQYLTPMTNRKKEKIGRASCRERV